MTTVADGPALARLAALLADDTRARFCLALLDGRAWTAGELARLAGVAPSTTSDHLTRLVSGGLLVEQRQGRHRYVRLADPSVAQLIEDLAGHAPAPPTPAGSLRAARAGAALAYARTCYDHLAGRLGVRLRDALLARRLLDDSDGLALTSNGLDWLAGLGVPVAPLRAARRPLVRDCLDWTERRSHLAGALGAALCDRFFEVGWLSRGSGRAVRLTPAGGPALAAALGLAPADLAPDAAADTGGGRA
ncbi:winged helix-turn-helix domain-containing protein [Micromonospora peucetia]|uniref:Transcriptional regulator, ArsR family n=1 Tax=Micromonospora peucetia TaxID=47871 RepID=A0A1C6VZX9_9ACTN|nr:winged helix-turn-helix domain-containing protein [Micromonospora peucetia]MCX4390740.1 winged helix-turn-helix domain-containing protein [Micromonospora peucetia]WSA31684.1 winged helix-turn-helix domain-containing protein [Micromonospora peucetia]SCL71674.1 transcriptional regulator, ArsR family [Micromonospora peucetia]